MNLTLIALYQVNAEGNNSGEYTIVFRRPFQKIPAVVTDQNYPAWDAYQSNGGYLSDNTVLIAVGPDRFKVKTGNGTEGTDRNFTFIAMGI